MQTSKMVVAIAVANDYLLQDAEAFSGEPNPRVFPQRMIFKQRENPDLCLSVSETSGVVQLQKCDDCNVNQQWSWGFNRFLSSKVKNIFYTDQPFFQYVCTFLTNHFFLALEGPGKSFSVLLLSKAKLKK